MEATTHELPRWIPDWIGNDKFTDGIFKILDNFMNADLIKDTTMKKLPLSGIRILDFCQMWAGPHATEWLSVLGAETIKVETAVRIDYMRTVGAPPGMAGKNPNVGSAFASLNWGKKSIAINMTTPKGQELAKKLIKISDVVAENFGGGVLERWGLSYEEMKKIKPDIIYYFGSGYGRSGPQ